MHGDSSPKTTSVVICCYTMDRWSDLTAAVAEVQRQSRGDTEIVVCVDHNPEMFRRAKRELSDVTVIENDQHQGLSGARNCAVEHAWGEIIAFLDDDAVPAPGWLAALTEPFADGQIAAVGGSATPSWPERRPAWFPSEFDWVVGCSYVGLPVLRAPVRNVMGCNMAFRRHVFASGLRFSPMVGRTGSNTAGCEETELCIQVRQRWPEAQIVLEPRAVVHHRVPSARCSWSYFARRCYAEGRSKARVSSLVGRQDALSSEWEYTRRTLPRGLGRGLREAVSGQASGLGRSAAIVAGLALTSFGYIRGRYDR
ncbi:MAG TPA: glycosyltransferase family 2 protein [Nocardioidaceae bacterium]|nr:glycosyltransferase family 2 protein [Nocardioidaceae bacterium]